MFNIFLITWVLIGFITFIYLFYENAPYGRHIKSGWGKKIPARLGWVLMESPCVYLMIILSIIYLLIKYRKTAQVQQELITEKSAE